MTAASQVILNFHGLGEPGPGIDADERPYWLAEDRFEQVLGLIDQSRASGRDVGITFDDGNLSDLQIGVPHLLAHDLTATFFVLTGRIGTPGYLGADDIKAMIAHGMRIGLHGRAHRDLRGLSDDELAAETVEARAVLSEITGQSVTLFAIPFGAYNARVMRHLMAQGFAEIHTSDGGVATTNGVIRARNTLRADHDDAALRSILENRYDLKQTLRRRVGTVLRRKFI